MPIDASTTTTATTISKQYRRDQRVGCASVTGGEMRAIFWFQSFQCRSSRLGTSRRSLDQTLHLAIAVAFLCLMLPLFTQQVQESPRHQADQGDQGDHLDQEPQETRRDCSTLLHSLHEFRTGSSCPIGSTSSTGSLISLPVFQTSTS